MVCVMLGLNALQLLNAAAAGSAPNPSSMQNSYGLFPMCCFFAAFVAVVYCCWEGKASSLL